MYSADKQLVTWKMLFFLFENKMFFMFIAFVGALRHRLQKGFIGFCPKIKRTTTKNTNKFNFFRSKTCIFQIFVVILQPILRV